MTDDRTPGLPDAEAPADPGARPEAATSPDLGVLPDAETPADPAGGIGYPSLEASLLAQGYAVMPPDVSVDADDGTGPWDDDEFGLDDSDAPILEEALAERTYVREGEVLGGRVDPTLPEPMVPAAPKVTPTPPIPAPPSPTTDLPTDAPTTAPTDAPTVPRRPTTLPDDRPPTPPIDLAERLRALGSRRR